MYATLGKDLPRGSTWTFEPRDDGVRVLRRIVAQLRSIERQGGDGEVDLADGKALHVPSLGKKYFANGVIKAALMRDYTRICPLFKQHVKDRPLMLKRYPDGDGEADVLSTERRYSSVRCGAGGNQRNQARGRNAPKLSVATWPPCSTPCRSGRARYTHGSRGSTTSIRPTVA